MLSRNLIQLKLLMMTIISVSTILSAASHASQLQTGSRRIVYTVASHANSTAGGVRFNKQIGPDTAAQVMYAATNFTWAVLGLADHPQERKNISEISLFVEDMGNASTAAHTNGTSIVVNANYISNYTANLRRQFSGIVYQEIAGIWQWNGKGRAPAGLVTGIAHYVRLQARYGTVEKVKPGEGERWDEGNGVTARFLIYCSQLKKGFVGDMNRKMRHGYTDGFFLDLLGKPVDHLWSNYKERYGMEARNHRAPH